MSSITKEPNGHWRERYRDPQRRSRSKTFSRKIEAEQFLTSVGHSKLPGSYVDTAAGRPVSNGVARQVTDREERFRPGRHSSGTMAT